MKASLLAPALSAPQTSPLELWKAVRTVWQRILASTKRPARRLRLAESLPLGERRFVAVIEFDESRFLVGGTAASLVLLTRLEDRGADDRRAKDDRAVPHANPGAEAEIASEERL